MRTLVIVSLLILLTAGPLAAQKRDSLLVDIVFTTKVEPRTGYSWCTSFANGVHADPVGNGRDQDYVYSRPPINGTPAEWTGLQDDIPGERITYFAGYNTGGDGGDGCGDQFARHKAAWEDIGEVWAYFAEQPNQPPTADFDQAASETEFFTIKFDASGSDDPDGQIVAYAWDFGDGTSGSGVSPTHTYAEGGAYEVMLTVEDDDGETDSVLGNVRARGPNLRYIVSLVKPGASGPPGGEPGEESVGDSLFVGDTVHVQVVVTNSGEARLEDVRLPSGAASIEVTVPPDEQPATGETLLFVGGDEAVIEALEVDASDTLTYPFKAVHAASVVTVFVGEVAAQAVHPSSGERVAYSVSESTCTVGDAAGKAGLRADGSENVPCVEGAIAAPPLVVNATADAGLDADLDPAEGSCTTGATVLRDGEPEPECTLRAAFEVAAARAAATEIRFDIPQDPAEPTEVHRIVLDNGSLPPVESAVRLLGGSQPDGMRIEIDGRGAGGIGLDLGGGGRPAVVEKLAFYGFPGTVLALRGQGSALTGSRIGTDWADSHTSTDADVTDPLRNGGAAVLVTGDNTVVGGVDEDGNLIVGSRVGVRVEGADRVEILGNDIGVLASPHLEHGVELVGAWDVVVGRIGAANRIAYNLGHGIRLDAETAPATIQANEIVRPRGDGIHVEQAPAERGQVLIGGPNAGDGNTIERSAGAGIRVRGPSDASPLEEAGVAIQGNRLAENEEIGIRLEGGSGVGIGGATGEPGTAPGNVIEDGVRFESGYGSWLRGNLVTHLDPATGLSEESEVVYVAGVRNTVGGETAAEGNVIYGIPQPDPDEDNPADAEEPSGFGVWDAGTSTTIQRNWIGNDGGSARPLYTGVVLAGTGAELVENVISGNEQVGLSVRAPATIEGNFIGTTETGNGALPNRGAGVELFTGALVGGFKEDSACERPCNVISGNEGPGILVRQEATGAVIQGNHIGIGVDGLTHVGNGESGIIALADGVRIGGENDIERFECAGPCNLIAANGGDGIRNYREHAFPNLSSSGRSETAGADVGGANELVIEGNLIGTGLPIPGSGNAGAGIALGALGSNNRVGDTGRRGNLISGNGGAGVLVLASSEPIYFKGNTWRGGTGNRIRGNRIHDNHGLAIDLFPNYVLPGGDGWSALDDGDADEGPNEMINWPYLVESSEGDAGPSYDLLVLWTGDPAAGGTYALDVYTSASCRGATADAENFLVSRDLVFPVAGGANVQAVRVDVPFVPSMPYYVATFTDAAGNTSELGNCRRAGERPERAIQDVEPGIRTLVNGLLLQVTQDGAAKSAAAGVAAGTAERSLIVMRSSAPQGAGIFEATAAQAPSGTTVMPRSTQGDLWEVVVAGGGSMRFDVCLEAPEASVDMLVLGRGPATNGAWRPYDTRLETVEGIRYACADAVRAMHLSLGTGEVAALAGPRLLMPRDGAETVDLSNATLEWEALGDATTYEVQVSLDAAFGMPLVQVTQLSAPRLRLDELVRSQAHYWRVRGVAADGTTGPWSMPFHFTTSATSVAAEEEALPDAFTLEGNYPNPFNPQTTIRYALPDAAMVRLVVHDLLGREVAVLVDGSRPAGRHEVVFEAGDLATGVYLYRLEADGAAQTRQMVLVK